MGMEKDPAVRTAIGKMLATIQLTMRGTPFLFQGQELAAVNQSFTGVEQLRDVESINRHQALIDSGMAPEDAWRQILAGSRDHSRVPMRWTPDGGFTTGTPWLVGTDHEPGFSAEEQAADPGSVYSWHRELIRLRRTHRALTIGALTWVHPHHKFYFAYYRKLAGEVFLIECNTSSKQRPRPRVGGTIVPVMGGPRRPMMEPWEATVSRVH
jgi:oligo-1,6-glucosidase